ncbi:MAG: DUF4198 domain-containing protein [Chitinophagaceae bacterium]
MKKLIIPALLVVGTLTASAHEYFLSAYHYKVKKGDTLEVHLFVADGLNVQLERPMQYSKTISFQLFHSNGTIDLLAATPDKNLPMVERTVDFDGLGLMVLNRNNTPHVMETQKFLDYLKEDHLENITVPKSAMGKPQREQYSRYIKGLVLSGKVTAIDTTYKKVLGQNMEIVFLNNPYLLTKDDVLKVQVFFLGKPLANKVITARNRKGSLAATEQTSRTNAQGICSFKLGRNGEWLIHATHMIASPDKAVADWDSFWASYSFGME